ncbi:MAG: hypothetical protein AB1758_14455, partial [Candidatus Eremiobacterota bacterium]
MNLAPAPIERPPLPTVAPGARFVDVAYTAPVTREETLGHIPSDHFAPGPVGFSSADDPVVVNQPVLGLDGKPTFTPALARLDLTPY